uniref:NADH dehydrogenase [ubiquinone] 1 beta subcomplex subunit 9 n=1 Tax=Phaeomonas parva TaxID=124430 RepID=A0A6U4KWM9_9STRA|mmetsp:Transcript_767/g.1952  ORF Transcript_767/g.1952 Transcript_767/m.1952 type:complete len:162 (+) Transcript_767:199-684(+)
MAFRHYNKALKRVVESVVANHPVPHNQRVMRLYRQGLKCLNSWAIEREIWNDKAADLRARFDKLAHLEPTSKAAIKALEAGEEELFTWDHPDRYIPAYMPGGSLFMRNPTPPKELVYPNGMPEGEEPFPESVNIDMTPISDEKNKTGGFIIVDNYRKKIHY